ncbi:hypothetical protein [Geminocystis sp. GBBB08]|uniref:hypothetical protein n=1 Tax=Geminocystis sp. GBBB08 TaxID=2604140 RepID=UPI0027E2FDD8|nr:hypothetical protein [Geminocystis sp. GBBB08]MBL1209803.1 hypothetical protein [Geminocystis sp. GBBB08]
MSISEMLEFIDEVMEDKTGNTLTDLQRSILEGTLKGQKYSEIGEKNGFSEGHVRDVGYELLQLLSRIFDKPLHKRNLKQFLEKQHNISNSVVKFGKKTKIKYFCTQKHFDNLQEIERETKEYQQVKYQVEIETAKKLKNKGLTDAEIGQILDIKMEELSNYLE